MTEAVKANTFFDTAKAFEAFNTFKAEVKEGDDVTEVAEDGIKFTYTEGEKKVSLHGEKTCGKIINWFKAVFTYIWKAISCNKEKVSPGFTPWAQKTVVELKADMKHSADEPLDTSAIIVAAGKAMIVDFTKAPEKKEGKEAQDAPLAALEKRFGEEFAAFTKDLKVGENQTKLEATALLEGRVTIMTTSGKEPKVTGSVLDFVITTGGEAKDAKHFTFAMKA